MGAGELETTEELATPDGTRVYQALKAPWRLAVQSRAEGGTTVEARIPGPPARLEGRPA
jgi:hypothetical protein